ncbi:MAG: VanZ family protein [Myxococcales bacterium]|nr:VanZ family protein [Myxococcales bacterium]
MPISSPLPATNPIVSPRAARWALAFVVVATYSTLSVVRTLSLALRDAGLLRIAIAAAFALVGLAVVVVLRRAHTRVQPRVALILALVAAVYLVVMWPMTQPEERAHFLQYGLIAGLALASGPRNWSFKRRWVAALLFTAAAGWIDEGIQWLLPTRYYDLRDVGFNCLAGAMALTSLAVLRPAIAELPRVQSRIGQLDVGDD